MKRLMAAGLEEGEIMVGELNGRGPMRISLPKVERGPMRISMPHGVSQRLGVNSMNKNQKESRRDLRRESRIAFTLEMQ